MDGGSWRARLTGIDVLGPMGVDGRVMRYWNDGGNGREAEAEVDVGGWHVYTCICICRELSLSLSFGTRAAR